MTAGVPGDPTIGRPDTATDPAFIEARGVMKAFGGAVALRDIDVSIAKGSIHALVGENGAGKSTLGRIIAGALPADQGEILLRGEPVRFRNPREAIRSGIAMIEQELAILPERSVAENVYLGNEQGVRGMVSKRRNREDFLRIQERLGFDLDPYAKAGSLRVADQQKVEIMRAIAREADVIVMDEPTAPLSREESEQLHQIMRGLHDGGTTIIFVSHFLDEVLDLSDTISILKDGRHVRTGPAAAETKDTLIQGMLGRSLETAFPDKVLATREEIVLRVDGLSRAGALEDISLEIRAGEVVGLAGLVGSGRTELARAIFGADPIDSGVVTLEGRPVDGGGPRAGIRNGIALVPESRKTEGLLMERSVRENLTIARLGAISTAGAISRSRERAAVAELIERMRIKVYRDGEAVNTLSGGNQQKVALAKWLIDPPKLLIVDEPTRGVDVGAKFAIYEVLQSLAADGMAILVISSELEEVMGLAERVLVMKGGRIVAEFSGDLEHQEEQILTAAFGAAPDTTDKEAE